VTNPNVFATTDTTLATDVLVSKAQLTKVIDSALGNGV